MEIKVLDGKNTIGGNKILIRGKRGVIFLDFGKNFKTWGNYFEEFLNPRSSVGIFDLWKLNLIPKFSNIYRDDLILSNFKSSVEREKEMDLKAIFLSHAHLDHAGFIPLLKENIPIITSSVTERILDAMQDTSGGKVLLQFSNFKKREESKNDKAQGVLVTKSRKESTTVERKFVEVNFESKNAVEGEIDGIKYKLFSVDHSVPGAMAMYLEVDGESIAYTGDIRFHGENAEGSYAFVEEVKRLKPKYLITEGTRTLRDIENKDKNKERTTEDDVLTASEDVVKQYRGKLVVADFGPRNVERLKTFLKIAEDTNRRLAVTDKDAHLIKCLKDVGFNLIDNKNLVVIDRKLSKEGTWLKELKEYLNEQYGTNKIVTMNEIGKNMGDYMLCYSFWDLINLLDIEIKGGAYIYSSSEAFSEEQVIDMNRLMNWLKFFDLKPFGIDYENGELSFSGNYHSSGHAPSSDLFKMIEEINPEILLPVHTENPLPFAERFKGMKIL